MRNRLLLLASLLLLLAFPSFGQRECGTMDAHAQELLNNPLLEQIYEQIEQQTQDFINNPGAQDRVVVTIPVVFHVVWNTAAENLSAAQLQTQLDVLNADFRRLNADAPNTPAVWQGIAADCEINFCLATQTPTGAATDGIVRRQTTVTSFSSNNAVKFTAQGGSDAWDRNKYLNFWVCDLSGGLLGYAQFPGGTAATDGIVCDYLYVGTIGTATVPFHLGRTATHEVGHWLNLRHIWGDDGTACTGSDLVTDTPNAAGPNYGCPGFPSITCSNGPNGDMHMNYMDYTDDACMNMFTLGQKARIQALFASGGARVSLMTSPGCQPPTGASCGTPTGLTATSITQTSALLSWTAVSGATSYTLQYKTAASSTWITASSTITGTSYTLTGLTAGTTYNFQVRATCGTTLGSYSATGTFTTQSVGTSCGTPTGLAASNITPSSALVSWGAVGGATSYTLQYKTAAATTWTTAATGLTATSFTLNGLAAATTYNFRVAATCGATAGSYSSNGTFTTQSSGPSCGAPTGVTAGNITTTAALITWNAVSGAGAYNLRYRVSTSTTWITVSSIPTTFYSLSGLTPGTAYSYQVASVCESITSAYVGGTFTTQSSGSGTCGTPGNLTATSITTSSATVSWGGVSGALSYTLQYKTAAATTWTTAATGLTATLYTLTGLTAATTYNFQVRATCATSIGAFSAPGTFTTLAASCPDQFEPNNTLSGAYTATPVNTPFTAKIATSTDVDYYRFSASSTAPNLKIDLTNLPANYDLRLYRSSTQVGVSQNTGTAAEQIIYNNASTLYFYYAQVYGVSGAFNASQCYTLLISRSASTFRTDGSTDGPIEQIEVPVSIEGAAFGLFPNPAQDEVTVEVPLETDADVTITLVDVAGRNVAIQNQRLTATENRVDLNTAEITNGVYFVQVRYGDRVATRKLIVQRI